MFLFDRHLLKWKRVSYTNKYNDQQGQMTFFDIIFFLFDRDLVWFNRLMSTLLSLYDIFGVTL